MQQRENYKKLQHQLESFIKYTGEAIHHLHQPHHNITQDTLQHIADSIFQLEKNSDQIMRMGDEEAKIEMQIIQNIVHDPIYYHPHSRRQISMFQAAKTLHDLHDNTEMHSLLQSCAEHQEEFHHLFSDLYDICEYVSDWIRKEKKSP